MRCCLLSDQVVENVTLVDVDRDEGFELCSLVFCQLLRGNFDERVEDSLKVSVCRRHDLFIQLLTVCMYKRVYTCRIYAEGS